MKLGFDALAESGTRCSRVLSSPGAALAPVGGGAAQAWIDPAQLAPGLVADRRLTHVRASAFAWQPAEPVDWLFCDMAWRPLEVASLLAKWARRRWAHLLVANLKLPMKRKAEMALRLRRTLAEGGWGSLRLRQLYHDREEVTVLGARA
jgi:23S rRNA (cytidine2498-2'-O)-methyltransferase